jgi:protein-S-isoprenylcysteine O-methyltransferase Ste14
MNPSTVLLAAANFALIGGLPFVFFKRGHFNAMWLLTALPFLMSGLSVLAAAMGYMPSFWDPAGMLGAVCGSVAVLAYATAFVLIGLTLGSHRVPLALWHQPDDPPQHIVSWGAYAHIRHPFYASFLLTLAGSLLLSPNFGTLLAFVYGFAMLNATAAREERRLSQSGFQDEYVGYLRRTGRFLPRLAGRRGAQ